MLDFQNTGVLDLFVDEPSVQMREVTIGEQSPNGPGLLKGKELATTFSFLRSNDLVWNYVVGNYLKGETPPPFDLLYWNSDSTNLPGPMYCWYLRHTYLENNLKVPGKVEVCGERVDLGTINAPSYIYASREDHIVPWEAAYMNTQAAERKEALRARRIRPHRRRDQSAGEEQAQLLDSGPATLPRDAHQWLDKATEHPGSWWTDWSNWLKAHAGEQSRCATLARQPQLQDHRTRTRPLRQSEGLIYPDSSTPTEGDSHDRHRHRRSRPHGVGKFGGTLAKTPAAELGAVVIRELLKRSNLQGEQISEVILGQVLQAGTGQNPARQAVIKAGLPHGVPAMTINKVCGSGLKAVMLAAQAIRDGDSEIVIAGGQESMSLAPHVLHGSRDGQRMGEWKMVDSMITDGLWDVYNQYHMGITAENVAKKYGVTREQQDALALASQQKAAAAQEGGRFKDEIVGVSIPQKKGDPIVFASDEYINKKTSAEALAGLASCVRQGRQRHCGQCVGAERRRLPASS